jgi:dolichol-phosphate mannosyltransferase
LFDRNASIVVGSRKVQGSATEGMPLWKRSLSNVVNRYMRRLIGVPVADMTSGYRVYRYNALCQLSFGSTGFAFLPEMLMHAHALGQRIIEEPIRFIFRVEGESKMKLVPTALSYLKLLSQRMFSIPAQPAIELGETNKDSREHLHTAQNR